MKKLLLTKVLAILVVFTINAQTAWVGISSHKQTESEVILVSSDIQSTSIGFSTQGYTERTVTTPEGKETIIGIPGSVQIMESGHPDLPKLVTNIIIPDTEEMQINIINSNYKEFNNIAVAPSKGHLFRNVNPEDVPYTYDEVYETDAFWPASIAQLENPFIMRDFRGQTISVFPIQYNPVTKTLRVYTEIVLEVVSNGNEGQEPLYRTRQEIVLEPEFGRIYDRFFINNKSAAKSYPMLEGEEGSLLIICYDNFMDAMQPFVDWKRTIGRKTEIVPKSEAGANAAAIKSFVADYYNNNDDFAYLLLVGDGPQIPPMTTSNGHSDNAYGYLVGSNSYNDIFVGRFSAENITHVETHVQKMIEYERDMTEADTWISKGIGVARNEGAGGGHYGEADFVHMDLIKDTLLNFTYTEVSRRYDGNVPGLPNATAANISNDINNGASIINYCNHGSVTSWSVAGYSASHVNNLTNVGKLPFIWAVACVNGDFVNNLCFAETWLRATHNGEPTGAIGMMAATINQLWQPPMCGQDEMNSIMTEESIVHGNTIKRTYGGISANGSMYMIPQYGASGIQTHDTWILFGDPTLMVRTAAPETIAATYNPVLFLGTSSFDVMADADGAVVSITYFDEVNEEIAILGTAIIDGGTATVNFSEPLSNPGVATMAITGFNKVTYINNELSIIPPEGPYVAFNGYVIDDSSGNNNNVAEYGELIQLNLSLKNVGVEVAEGVEANLSTENEHVTLIDTHNSWGDIADDMEVMMDAAFSFQIDDVIPDNHNVLLTLTITDTDGNEWESNFSVRIFSPMFSIGELFIDDSQQGDNNGRLDPGETAKVIVRYTNTGGGMAMSPVSEIFASNPYLTIINEVIEHNQVPAGEYIEAEYTVQAHESAVPGTLIDVMFNIEDAHYFESEQMLVIGQVPEIVVGEGNTTSSQYPFYNYYKANRSQMIYTAAELGSGEKTITEIGFNITRASSAENDLPNFYIRMMHVDNTSFSGTSSFINTNNAEVVYQASAYQMPSQTGWKTWDLQTVFEYDGESNLLIEIVWGILPNWTSTFYQVASTGLSSPMVAYGFSDTQAVPAFSGTSSTRPNLYIAFAAEVLGEIKAANFFVVDSHSNILEGADVKIGSMTQYTGEDGFAIFDLMPGNYSYNAFKEGYQAFSGFFDIMDNDLYVTVVLAGGSSFVNNIDGLDIEIYPNPTRNIFNVKLQSDGKNVSFKLMNFLGQTIEEKEVRAQSGENLIQFSLEGFSKGVYYLIIESGENVTTKKIILQ